VLGVPPHSNKACRHAETLESLGPGLRRDERGEKRAPLSSSRARRRANKKPHLWRGAREGATKATEGVYSAPAAPVIPCAAQGLLPRHPGPRAKARNSLSDRLRGQCNTQCCVADPGPPASQVRRRRPRTRSNCNLRAFARGSPPHPIPGLRSGIACRSAPGMTGTTFVWAPAERDDR
jgi:hypothetical protein